MNLTALDLMVTESLPNAITAQTACTQARRYHYLNRGYYKFVAKTQCIESVIDITTVDEQDYYTSSDAANLAYIYKPYEVRYIDAADADNGWKLRPFPGGHRAIPRVKSYARPDYYWVQFTNVHDDIRIGTWPVANANGDTLRIYAYMFPTSELSTGTDVPVIKEFAHDALAYYAIAEIYRMFKHINPDWDKLSQQYMQMFEAEAANYKYFMFEDMSDEYPTFIADDEYFGDY